MTARSNDTGVRKARRCLFWMQSRPLFQSPFAANFVMLDCLKGKRSRWRLPIQFAASVLAATLLSFALAIFSFVFRGTELLAWTETTRSSEYRAVMGADGYGWTGLSFHGFGWTEIEQTAVTPLDVYPSSASNTMYPASPCWASMAELPIPHDDARLCANCVLTRVDGAFGWPLRIIAFRAESAWSWNLQGPSGLSGAAFTLEPQYGWRQDGPIGPLKKVYGFSGDGLVPARMLLPGLLANTTFFTVLMWLPFLLRQFYLWNIARMRTPLGACVRCGYDVAKQPEGSTCPECGRKVGGSGAVSTGNI